MDKKVRTVLVIALPLLALAGIATPFFPDALERYRDLTTQQAADLIGVALLLSWGLTVLARRLGPNGFDWFNPSILLSLLFVVSSVARVMFNYSSIQIDGFGVYTRLQDQYVLPYMLLVVLGFVGLLVGRAAAEAFMSKQVRDVTARPTSDLDDEQLIRLERYALALVLLSVAAFAYVRLPILLNPSGYVYGRGQWEFGVNYYIFLFGLLIWAPALAMQAYALAARTRSLLHVRLLAPFALVAIFMVAAGSRMPLIAPTISLILVQHYFVRPIQLGRVVLYIAVVGYIGFVAVLLRTSGFSYLTLAEQLTDTGLRDALVVMLQDFGSPAFITTHVMSWYPNDFPYLYGATYLYSIFNLVPGFFFGGALSRFPTAAIIFKNIFESGRFNPDQGYGFAYIAEAYMNFGWTGVFLIMALTGLVLQLMYHYAVENSQQLRWWVFVAYITIYPPLIPSLRSDTTGLFKTIFYALIFIYLARFYIFDEARLRKKVQTVIGRVRQTQPSPAEAPQP